MAEAKSINPATPVDPGLDFVELRKRGLEIIRQLAGDVWTDYNEHDPGVTTLEQLCYALTEVSYGAHLPIEDLLARPGTNGIDPAGQGLFTPQTILPCNPLTESDYRKLIVDRVPAVANAWLTAYKPPSRAGAVNGLYEIELYIPEPSRSPDGVAARTAAVRRKVRRVYTQYRSLCEDVHAIHVLKPVRASLTARVAIEAGATPESVLAQLLYNAGQFLAPELRRQGLDALLADGRTPASIFSGPLLRGGFISDDQLQPRPVLFAIGDVTRILLGTGGVTNVRDVSIAIDGAAINDEGRQSTLVVPRRSILTLDVGPEDRTFGIRLFRNEVECRVDPNTVHRELDRLWAGHRRRYDVRAQCERLLEFPAGTPADVGQYYSIQHQFPGIYGVNARGVPDDASEARKAQARQFKAYLLVFEQLLADAFARLAAVNDLYAIRGGRQRPAFQYLNESVPDVAPLLKDSYRTGLPAILQHGERALERRSRFLDFMLATYAEAIDPIVPPPTVRPSGTDSAGNATSAQCKLELLRHLTRVGRRRGAGIDYLSPSTRRDVAGLEIKSRLQLGMIAATPRPFAELLDELGVAITETAPMADRAWMLRHARHIDQQFEPVGLIVDRSDSSPIARATVSEDLLFAAASVDNYRIGTLPGQSDVTVVCRAPSQPLWQLAGDYPNRDAAMAGAAALLETARAVNQHARRLYIVEHTLLRFSRSRASSIDDAEFVHSFTASAIICLPAREANDPGYRQSVRHVIRGNAPAHVVINSCFLRLSRASQFETLYWDWREALRQPYARHLTGRQLRDLQERRAAACQQLRDFLGSDRP